MFVKDGVAHAGEPVAGMKVSAAKVVNDLSMLVTFSTGETRLFDASPLLLAPVFVSLADRSIFSDFAIDHGVLTWEDGGIDIAPEKVYAMSYAYDQVA